MDICTWLATKTTCVVWLRQHLTLFYSRSNSTYSYSTHLELTILVIMIRMCIYIMHVSIIDLNLFSFDVTLKCIM